MTQSTYILRLVTRRINLTRKYSQTDQKRDPKHFIAKEKRTQLESLIEKYREKILFNSHIDGLRVRLGNQKFFRHQFALAHKEHEKTFETMKLPPLPISLKYVVDESRLLKEKNETVETYDHEEVFQLPFAKSARISHISSTNNRNNQEEFDKSDMNKWMTSYDHFDDTKLKTTEIDDEDTDDADELNLDWCKFYGNPDPSQRVSNVPCFGCGALLHCNDTSIPGYIPSELYKNRTTEELKTTECQRCHFLKEYNVALNINVEPDEYATMLKSIKYERALVILMVDLLDFPCSIWPGIIDIIGTKRPLVVVGNKVDLLPGDSKGYLKHIEASLINEINKTDLGTANIKAISLISAKTGYGIEDLISNLFKIWLYKGDVYLVGCTNVGKSSLFNALLQSDYCKVHAHDLIQRATVSRWPGTTLNMLKFPINRPSGWKIYTRTKRLDRDKKLLKAEANLRKLQLGETSPANLPTLIGRIGRTFVDTDRVKDVSDPFSYGSGGQTQFRPQVFDEKDPKVAKGRWCFDTPGVVHPDQILSLLTAEELLQVIPKDLIRPQTFFLKSASTIFIGGIARLDFLECTYPCRFTVFCSKNLPITITKCEDADDLYSELLGTDLLLVPHGNEDRLKEWPGLETTDTLEFVGEGNRMCCADVVLSSAGWISVTAPHGLNVKVAAWTPKGKGIHVRKPSMLQHAVMLKGKRIRDTPAYMVGNIYIDDDDNSKDK